MDDYELADKLLKEQEDIDEVWNGNAHFGADDNGVPMLTAWHQLKSDDKQENRVYKYEGGRWVMHPELESKE